MTSNLRLPWRRALEIAFGVLVAAWLILPWIPGVRGILNPFLLPRALAEAVAAKTWTALTRWVASVLVYSLPVLTASRLGAPLLAPKLPRVFAPSAIPSILVGILWTLAAAAPLLLHAYLLASGPKYFASLHPLVYATFALAMTCNGVYLGLLIRALNRRSGAYREYLQASRDRQASAGRLPRNNRGSIRTRLVLLFVGITLTVVTVLSMVLLRDFRSTILATVSDNGRNLAERSASVVKANLTDEIAIRDYFEIERRKNLATKVRFNSLSYYQKQGRSDLFVAMGSTDATILGRWLPPSYRDEAAAGGVYDRRRGTLSFVSPVTLGRGQEAKLAGFAVVVYDRSVIYQPYFRTQIKVILFSALFLYVSVFLVYALGGSIALPILALGMSVNRMSSALSSMIAGRVRVSAARLDYRDMVRTRDEIKDLSREFSRMAAVIRGVVPYISASTLKHAHHGALMSQSRDLAFLFTDIRGFTALCEGLSPEEVVRILNRFLELQSSIILEHDGDIDKFVGDAIMAAFEGPDKEVKACRAALGIRAAMAAETERRRASGQKLLAIGIGIHSGPVVFGSVGAGERRDFTSIGDTVNLAARLEGANKEYGTGTLISQTVHEKVLDRYLCREIDLLTLKGKSRAVRVFEILGDRAEASREAARLKERFEGGLAAYRRQRWEEAAAAFRDLSGRSGDAASAVFLERIDFFRKNPPGEGWDGVFALQVK